MAYVSKLRKLVGHMPLQLPGTGLIVFRKVDSKYYFLLQYRSKDNSYGLLGGGIEPLETYRECANRELHEESGLFSQEKNFKLQEVYAGPRHVTVHPNKDVVLHTVVVYTVDYSKCSLDDIKLDQETQYLAWFDLDEIKELLAQNLIFPNNAPILEDLIDGNFHF